MELFSLYLISLAPLWINGPSNEGQYNFGTFSHASQKQPRYFLHNVSKEVVHKLQVRKVKYFESSGGIKTNNR